MKRKDNNKSFKPSHVIKEPVKGYFMSEGKFIHGTKGKPSRGARGNKKY
jgi:hypothetical protein